MDMISCFFLDFCFHKSLKIFTITMYSILLHLDRMIKTSAWENSMKYVVHMEQLFTYIFCKVGRYNLLCMYVDPSKKSFRIINFQYSKLYVVLSAWLALSDSFFAISLIHSDTWHLLYIFCFIQNDKVDIYLLRYIA